MVRMEKVCWAPSEQQEPDRASYLLSTYDCPSDQDNNVIIKYTDEKNTVAWLRGGTNNSVCGPQDHCQWGRLILF